MYVLRDENGWVKFRVTKKDVGWSGWVEKTLTIPWEKYEKEKVSQWLNNTVNSVDGYKRGSSPF